MNTLEGLRSLRRASEALGADVRGRTGRAALALLAGLCVFGLVVRLWGIGYLLPLSPIGDGTVPVAQLEVLRGGFDPAEAPVDAAYYPYLYAHVIRLLPTEVDATRAARNLEEHLSIAAAPWRESRIASVLLSMLAVPCTWLLARRFLGDGWAVLAAAFLGTSFLHVDFSAQERPHGPVTSLILIAILAAIHLRRRGDLRAYLIGGVTAGLAIGILQSGLSVLPAFAVAIVLRERSARRASPWWALASLGVVAAFVRWLYPFHFASRTDHVSVVEDSERGLTYIAGHEVFLDEFDGYGFRRTLETLWSYDPILLFAATAGAVFLAVLLLRERERVDRALVRDALVVLGHALPYLLVTGMYMWTLERFVMPLLPALACLAAYGTRRALESIGRFVPLGRARPVLAACLPALAALPGVQLARVHAARDTQTQVADWFRANVAPDERIVVVPYIDLPLFHDEFALAENAQKPASHWLRYQMQLEPWEFAGPRYQLLIVPGLRAVAVEELGKDPMAYFAAQGARFVAITVPGELLPMHQRALESLRRNAQLMLRVTPERRDAGGGYVVVARHVETITRGPIFTRPYCLEIFDAARMGWAMEVYRLDP